MDHINSASRSRLFASRNECAGYRRSPDDPILIATHFARPAQIRLPQ